MNSDEHQTVREQLGAYVLGQLGGREWTAVQAHLAGCPECRAEVDAIAPLAAPLRGVHPDRLAEDPAPPPGLRDAVLTRISAEAGSGPISSVVGAAVRQPQPPTRRRPGPSRLAAAAAVLAVLAAGVGFVLGSQTGAAPVPLEPVAMRTVAADVRADANLVAHTWGTEIKLDGTGFAPGTVYRVTVTDDRGRVVGAGEFVGTGSEEMQCNLNSSVLRSDARSFQVHDQRGLVVASAEI